MMDSQFNLDGFYLSNAIGGLEFDPMELAALVESVSRDDVVSVARSLVPDAVYFLRGNDDEEVESDEA